MSEPTSKINDLSSETVTKLISILVAIVVFAVVLVPIVNGLADGDGDGGGGGTTEKVYINDLQEIYADMGAEIPYHSYQVYAYPYDWVTPLSLSEFTEPIHITLENLNDMEQYLSLNISNLPENYNFSVLNVQKSIGGGSFYQCELLYSNEGLKVVAIDGNSGPHTLISNISEFELNIDTEYSVSLNMAYSDLGTPRTLEIEFTSPDEFWQISTEMDGWVSALWTQNNQSGSKFIDVTFGKNTSMYLQGIYYNDELGMSGYLHLTNSTISDNYWTITFDNLSIYESTSDEIDSLIITSLIEPVTNDTWHIVGYVDWMDERSMDNPFTASIIESGQEIQLSDGWTGLNVDWISTYDNGSGSGSDSAGISGTAGTILKIIPVLVGVGVILAIVALFYDPRQLLGGQQ